MVEMKRRIFSIATAQSLVLDEIGRGTKFDGLSIAWAVEYLALISGADNFTTHYHELNELASILVNVAIR